MSLILLCLMNNLSAQQTDVFFDETGTRIIRGRLTEDSLNHDEWYHWFVSGKARYRPSRYILNKLKPYKDSLSFSIVMGTWCGDTKLQVPRLVKIFSLLGIGKEAVSWYGVDRDKQGNGTIPNAISFTNIPTVVVSYKGTVIGTIVESPQKSLEKDIWNMLKAQLNTL